MFIRLSTYYVTLVHFYEITTLLYTNMKLTPPESLVIL
jgi:hypothetical protein